MPKKRLLISAAAAVAFFALAPGNLVSVPIGVGKAGQTSQTGQTGRVDTQSTLVHAVVFGVATLGICALVDYAVGHGTHHATTNSVAARDGVSGFAGTKNVW